MPGSDHIGQHIDVGGFRLHYYDSGHGAPVVMLHGGGPGASALSNFGRNLPVFAKEFRTLLVDQPGFGDSDKPEITSQYFTFSADAVLGLLDRLGIEKA